MAESANPFGNQQYFHRTLVGPMHTTYCPSLLMQSPLQLVIDIGGLDPHEVPQDVDLTEMPPTISVILLLSRD